MGHAMGLEHAFEGGPCGIGTIPDNPQERIMGYDRIPNKWRLIKGERDIIRTRAASFLGN
jgi:hypothetical protein